jgi:hypothetical protein
MQAMPSGTVHIKGTWKPILDEATWMRCREILTNPARRVSFTHGLTHFLSGALVCGKDGCGGPMRHNSTRALGPRYKCAKCNHSIEATTTEDFVTANLLSLIDDEAWRDLQARGKRVDRVTMDRYTGKLETARAMWMDDVIDDAEWMRVQTDVAARLASLTESESLELPSFDSLHTHWATADAADKRMVCTTVFESITVMPRTTGVNGTQRIVMLNRDLEAVT